MDRMPGAICIICGCCTKPPPRPTLLTSQHTGSHQGVYLPTVAATSPPRCLEYRPKTRARLCTFPTTGRPDVRFREGSYQTTPQAHRVVGHRS